MNIIAFSVWGTASSYNYGVLDNCIMLKYKLPRFQCWVYHNNSLPDDIKQCLKKLSNVRLISMNNTSDKRNTLWRFLPAFNPKVNVFLSRDTDSRLQPKEIKAIREWMKSDKDFHIIRDHFMHRRKILAGMWGCKNQILVPLYKDYIKYISVPYKASNWIVDEIFLENIVYPYVKNKAMVHASYNKYEGKNVCKDLDQTLPNIYGHHIGCPVTNVTWIKKKFPQLNIPSKLMKFRVGT